MAKSRELVITRGEGEAIIIGDPRSPIARVIVRSLKGSARVRLGVVVDSNTPVHRDEVAKSFGLDEDEPPAGVLSPR
jgi:sRNA-binding carbon storage regulator CsrA